MNFSEIIYLIGAVLGILVVVLPFVYKVFRGAIMEEVNAIEYRLEKSITEKGKSNINYMGKACEDLIKTYEQQNEKIRTERQLRYSKNIDDIHDLCNGIKRILDVIQFDMIRNGEKLVLHEERISTLQSDLKEIKNSN